MGSNQKLISWVYISVEIVYFYVAKDLKKVYKIRFY